jgi:hypothetical protein
MSEKSIDQKNAPIDPTSVVDDQGSPSPLNQKITLLWRIFRPILYLGAIWCLLIYFWSFLGILFGLGLFLFEKDKTWVRHGIFISMILGFSTYFMDSYMYMWLLFTYLIFFVYIIGAILVPLVKLAVKAIRKHSHKQKKMSKKKKSFRTFNAKLRFGIKVVAVLTPILLWSSVNVQLGIMWNNETTLLWVHTPSMAGINEDIPLTVEAWDSFERISGSYLGTVEFTLRSYDLVSGVEIGDSAITDLEPYAFTGKRYSSAFVPAYELSDTKDYGMHTFSLQIDTPGIHYVLVTDSVSENTYWSNPIYVDNFPVDTPKLAWGDIHSHTMVSDGSGSVDHSYNYARNVAMLEFCSVTDHGEHLNLNGLAPEGSRYFDNYVQATNDANDPGNFVALQGAEWTTNYVIQPLLFWPVPIATGGHYTMVFDGDSIPLFGGNYQTSTTELWDVLDDFTDATGNQALAVPHHTIRSMFIQDWTLMNPDYVKLVEVSSVHGECLFPGTSSLNYRGSVDLPVEEIDGSSIIEALNMGNRMSFIASGDNHDGHPGHSLSHTDASIGYQWPFTLYNARNGHPYPSGLTAVWTSDLTRTDVFSALNTGAVYGNSDYGRPVIQFAINGVEAAYNATVVVDNATSSRDISIFLAQDGAPAATMDTAATVTTNWIPNWAANVEIIKNGELWQNIPVSGPITRINITDSSAITGASYDESIEKDDGLFYINNNSLNPVDPTQLTTGGADYYTIRVVGANGRTSYIGPIWVEF